MKINFLLIIFILITIHSLKEILKEFGCKPNNGTLNCDINNNNFIRNNKLKNDETVDSALYKIKDIIRHYEKVGKWKYFYILSIISVLIILLIFKDCFNVNLNINMCITMVIVICMVNHFHDSWMTFHIYRDTDKNADALIDFIYKNCIKK
jgi:hypothetical protein